MKKILDACCGSRMFWFDKENKNDYEIGAYSDTYKGFFVRQFWYENITHWMPLPRTPKERGGENGNI